MRPPITAPLAFPGVVRDVRHAAPACPNKPPPAGPQRPLTVAGTAPRHAPGRPPYWQGATIVLPGHHGDTYDRDLRVTPDNPNQQCSRYLTGTIGAILTVLSAPQVLYGPVMA